MKRLSLLTVAAAVALLQWSAAPGVTAAESPTSEAKGATASFATWDVDCVTDSWCAVVGLKDVFADGHSTYSPTFAIRSGSRWRTPPILDLSTLGATPTYFTSVSCTSTSRCLILGIAGVDGDDHASRFSAVWSNDAGWSHLRVEPKLPWWNLSCKSDSRCVALTGNGSWPSARWNGDEWHKIPMRAAFIMSGLTCKDLKACRAVGEYYDGRHTYAAVGTLVAGKWKLKALPARGYLTAIACLSRLECIAVGVGDGADRGLSYRWTRRTGWRALDVPTHDASRIGFRDIDCTRKACSGVGRTGIHGGFTAVWKMRPGWKIERTYPYPAVYELSEVSCASGRLVCIAGGNDLRRLLRRTARGWSALPDPWR